jgi:hypothetical protein
VLARVQLQSKRSGQLVRCFPDYRIEVVGTRDLGDVVIATLHALGTVGPALALRRQGVPRKPVAGRQVRLVAGSSALRPTPSKPLGCWISRSRAVARKPQTARGAGRELRPGSYPGPGANCLKIYAGGRVCQRPPRRAAEHGGLGPQPESYSGHLSWQRAGIMPAFASEAGARPPHGARYPIGCRRPRASAG